MQIKMSSAADKIKQAKILDPQANGGATVWAWCAHEKVFRPS